METQITFSLTAYKGYPSDGDYATEMCHLTIKDNPYVQMRIGSSYYEIPIEELTKALTLLQLAAKP